MKKQLHLEVIRILGILSVMFIHSGYRGHEAYSCTDSGITFVVSLVLACVSAIGVDLFWMVSGALLLGKNEDAKYVYTKRLPRILIVLLVFSVIRYFYDWFMGVYGADVYWAIGYGSNAGAGHAPIGVLDFLRRFFSGAIFVPYWFLYSYIGILLILPFLRRAIQNMSMNEWKYLAVIELCFLIVIRVIELIPNTSFGVPFFMAEAVNTFILGYAAEKVVPRKWLEKWKNLIGIILLVIIFVAVEYYLTVTLGNPVGENRKVFTDIFIIPIALGVVLVIRGLSFKMGECPKWLSKTICFAGSCTFGLYLIEDYLRQLLVPVDEELASVITVMPACIVWLLSSFVVGILVVGLMKKIPGFGKLI